jgi:isoleucyl-tRNA synthetase
MLRTTRRLAIDVAQAYQSYELVSLSHRILNFSTVDLSSLYLDVNKDRLYCDHPEDPRRRATQTVIYRIAETLAALLAPVLSFTADEVWQLLPGEREESVHLALIDVEVDESASESEADRPIKRLLDLRDVVLAQLEDLGSTGIDLASFLIVSAAGQGTLDDGGAEVSAYPGLSIAVVPYEAETCSRCWRRVEAFVDDPDLPELCDRCHTVVHRLLDEGRAELDKADA